MCKKGDVVTRERCVKKLHVVQVSTVTILAGGLQQTWEWGPLGHTRARGNSYKVPFNTFIFERSTQRPREFCGLSLGASERWFQFRKTRPGVWVRKSKASLFNPRCRNEGCGIHWLTVSVHWRLGWRDLSVIWNQGPASSRTLLSFLSWIFLPRSCLLKTESGALVGSQHLSLTPREGQSLFLSP